MFGPVFQVDGQDVGLRHKVIEGIDRRMIDGQLQLAALIDQIFGLAVILSLKRSSPQADCRGSSQDLAALRNFDPT